MKINFLIAGISMGVAFFMGVSTGSGKEKMVYPKDPQACATCHIIKPYVESWNNSNFLDHKHKKSGITCNDCHQLTIRQQESNISKFRKKAYKTPFKEREYGKEFCFRCHGSYKEIQVRTKDYQAKNLPRDPHKSHYEEMECSMCHKAHRASVDYCSQCHQPGMNKKGWKTLQ